MTIPIFEKKKSRAKINKIFLLKVPRIETFSCISVINLFSIYSKNPLNLQEWKLLFHVVEHDFNPESMFLS